MRAGRASSRPGLRRLGAAALTASVLASACGGGSPSAPSPPEPSAPANTLTAVVFYDENGNGTLEAGEEGRLANAVVEVAGRTGRAEQGSGRVTVSGLPSGTHTASVRADSLPPYYRPGPAASVSLPQSSPVNLPATLAIGSNRANTYLGFGDSITDGDDSSDGDGYRGRLETLLRQHFGTGGVRKDGAQGTTSRQGAQRIDASLRSSRPAYVLILYGTNDWNSSDCNSDITTCYTAASFQSMIRSARNADTWPVVSTIIPANTGYDQRAPPDRNVRIEQQNQQIKAVARAEGAVVADSYAAFMQTADFHRLLTDHVHPNDAGFELIARAFFDAITRPGGGAAAGFDAPLLLELTPAPSRVRGRPSRSPRGAAEGSRGPRPDLTVSP